MKRWFSVVVCLFLVEPPNLARFRHTNHSAVPVLDQALIPRMVSAQFKSLDPYSWPHRLIVAAIASYITTHGLNVRSEENPSIWTTAVKGTLFVIWVAMTSFTLDSRKWTWSSLLPAQEIISDWTRFILLSRRYGDRWGAYAPGVIGTIDERFQQYAPAWYLLARMTATNPIGETEYRTTIQQKFPKFNFDNLLAFFIEAGVIDISVDERKNHRLVKFNPTGYKKFPSLLHPHRMPSPVESGSRTSSLVNNRSRRSIHSILAQLLGAEGLSPLKGEVQRAKGRIEIIELNLEDDTTCVVTIALPIMVGVLQQLFFLMVFPRQLGELGFDVWQFGKEPKLHYLGALMKNLKKINDHDKIAGWTMLDRTPSISGSVHIWQATTLFEMTNGSRADLEELARQFKVDLTQLQHHVSAMRQAA